MSSSAPLSWPSVLSELIAGRDLDVSVAHDVMSTILRGEATAAQIAGFLVALRAKGEQVDELTGLLDSAMEQATIVPLTDDERARCVDIVGTGGDGSHSINVSTMAALVIAGSGVPVCKHGNRSGVVQVRQRRPLGVAGRRDRTPCRRRCRLRPRGRDRLLLRAGVPSGLPVRRTPGREIGVPTAFNLLGPMANPGRVRRQVIGVADPRFVEPMVLTLQREGRTHAWVVHGDGLDELTTTGPSRVLSLADGSIDEFTVDPAELGLAPATPDDLRGGDPDENADAIRRVLAGERGPHRDIVVLNAAAGLVVGGAVADLAEGLATAELAIDEGRAQGTLDALVRVSQAHAE